jgi:hypothetical protein
MERWGKLISILKKLNAESEFVTECVWACITEEADEEFENELLEFLNGQ